METKEVPEDEGRPVTGWIATRTTGGAWHWVVRLSSSYMVPKCSAPPGDWGRSIRPSPGYRVEMEEGDVLCRDCDAIHEWEGLVKKGFVKKPRTA